MLRRVRQSFCELQSFLRLRLCSSLFPPFLSKGAAPYSFLSCFDQDIPVSHWTLWVSCPAVVFLGFRFVVELSTVDRTPLDRLTARHETSNYQSSSQAKRSSYRNIVIHLDMFSLLQCGIAPWRISWRGIITVGIPFTVELSTVDGTLDSTAAAT